MEIKVFVHDQLRQACNPALLALITERFVKYKQDGIRHPTFGTDRPYFRPPSIQDVDLRHIHIKDATAKWNLRYMRIDDMTSDTALIYCAGFMRKDHYLLISLIKDAHSYYGGTEQYIRAMAAIARKFQEKF